MPLFQCTDEAQGLVSNPNHHASADWLAAAHGNTRLAEATARKGGVLS